MNSNKYLFFTQMQNHIYIYIFSTHRNPSICVENKRLKDKCMKSFKFLVIE